MTEQKHYRVSITKSTKQWQQVNKDANDNPMSCQLKKQEICQVYIIYNLWSAVLHIHAKRVVAFTNGIRIKMYSKKT